MENDRKPSNGDQQQPNEKLIAPAGREEHPAPKPDTNQSNGRYEKKHPLEWGIFILLFFTLIATGVAAYYTRKQWITADDTEKRSLRAYILPEKAWLINIDDDRPFYEFHTKNYGQTPAKNVTVWAAWRYFDIRGIKIPNERPKIEYSKYLVGPQGFTVNSDQIYLDADRKRNIHDGTGVFFIFGDVQYKDVFGTDRTTKFRFVWKKGFELGTGSGALMVDTEGNDAD